MKQISQLTNPNVVVDRNILNSDMDKIDVINSNIDVITAVGTPEVLAEISTVAGLDFGPILAGVDVVENLSVTVVETLPAGQPASAELVGNDIQLKIPAGLDGTNGLDGLTPVYDFAYDAVSGMLSYELIEYSDINTGSTVAITSVVDYAHIEANVVATLNTQEEW